VKTENRSACVAVNCDSTVSHMTRTGFEPGPPRWALGWLIVNVVYFLVFLHHVVVSDVADVSKVHVESFSAYRLLNFCMCVLF
jgi:hypothetical protein